MRLLAGLGPFWVLVAVVAIAALVGAPPRLRTVELAPFTPDYGGRR